VARSQHIDRAMQQAATGRIEEAIASLRLQLRLKPVDLEAMSVLGALLVQSGQMAQAITVLERCVAAFPRHAMAHNNLANAYMQAGRLRESARHYERALELHPDHMQALLGLSFCRTSLEESEAAIAAAERGLAIQPDLTEMHINHGLALAAADRLDDALASMRRVLARRPQDADLRSQFLLALNYLSLPAEEIAREHRDVRLGVRGTPEPPDTGRDPDRPLRVGVLSGDLREHSVGYFADAPLARMPEGWKLVVFSLHSGGKRDPMLERYEALADEWVKVAPLDAASIDAEIRRRRIDVLLELGGHTGGGRLQALDRKPAPVVVSAIGYPNTTGHPSVDLRFVDSVTDPAGSDALCTERLVRLDPCFLCYRPLDGAPEPAMPAADAPITFGSFNLTSKIREATIALWSRVLADVPGSRLLLKAKSLKDGGMRKRLLARFEAGGIDPARVETIAFTDTVQEHLALYSRIHVALDSTPYNGTTTTCEALWMGVPVVCVRGDRHSARVGASLLNAAGCAEFLAEDADGFVRIATGLAGDRERLARLRSGLRDRLRGSPLLDADAYAARFHAALRQAWRDHCGTGATR
jgi:predicted O-linked N-acetylglucosamine transferase (SPINDLY family)